MKYILCVYYCMKKHNRCDNMIQYIGMIDKNKNSIVTKELDSFHLGPRLVVISVFLRFKNILVLIKLDLA